MTKIFAIMNAKLMLQLLNWLFFSCEPIRCKEKSQKQWRIKDSR